MVVLFKTNSDITLEQTIITLRKAEERTAV